MNFSFAAFLATIVAVIICGIASLIEGTLTNKKVTIGFLTHGGMWSDLIVMSIVNGLCFPHFVKNKYVIMFSLSMACIITVIAHAKWADYFRTNGITGHMFPTHQDGVWYRDISTSGWGHIGVMVLLLASTIMYTVSPTPPGVVFTVSLLLTLHVFVGTVQPGWHCTGKLWTWTNFAPPLVATGLVWTIGALKIYFTKQIF